MEVDLESAEVSPSVTTTPRRHQIPLTELHKASHHIKLKSCVWNSVHFDFLTPFFFQY